MRTVRRRDHSTPLKLLCLRGICLSPHSQATPLTTTLWNQCILPSQRRSLPRNESLGVRNSPRQRPIFHLGMDLCINRMRLMTNLITESVQRQKMKRNNVVSNGFSAIVQLLSHLVSESVKKSRSSKARRWVLSSKTSFFRSGLNRWKRRRTSWPSKSSYWQPKWPSFVTSSHPPTRRLAQDQSPTHPPFLRIY